MTIITEISALPAIDGPVVALQPVTDRHTWERLLARAAFPQLPQSYAYGAGKAADGWTIRRVRFDVDGKPAAIATVLERRVLGITLLRRINRGPVFLSAKPPAAQLDAVYTAIRRRWGRLWHGLLLMAPTGAGTDPQSTLARLGYRRRSPQGWRSGRLDLTRTEADIWAGFAPGFRNRYRKAEAAGARLVVSGSDEAFEWMIGKHLRNMAERGFKAVGADFLRAMRAEDPGAVLVFQALAPDGEPVAGMSVVRFGTSCEYHIGWFGPEGRTFNAGNFLMWNIVRHMKGLGARSFDLGGIAGDGGYSQFKRTMNPVEYELAGEWMSV